MNLFFYFLHKPLLTLMVICFNLCYLTKKEKIIAKVGNKYLYNKDIPKMGERSKELSKEIKKYAYEWVKNQLIIAEAKKLGYYNRDEIAKKVENYRNELVIYDFINTYIKNNLSTDVTEKEILSYYKKNKNNFELKDNIVRCRFVIIPKVAPNSNKLINLFYPSDSSANKKLLEYCTLHAKSYFLNSNIWISFSKMIEQTPLEFRGDKVGLVKRMKKKRLTKLIGSENIYYFQVYEYKINSDVSPFEFVESKIKEIIIHQRRLKLKQRAVDKIIQKAKRNGEFTIY